MKTSRATLTPDIQLGLLIVLAVVVLQQIYTGRYGQTPVFPTDDAYITLRNAELLRSGQPDPVFVGSAALVGSTSLVHTVLVALALYVLPPLHALDLTLWLGMLLYGLSLARLAREQGASVGVSVLVVALGWVVGRTPYQLLNGLETGLALAATTFALTLAARPAPQRSLAIICGILPFLRPELAALSALLLIQQAVRRRQLEESFRAIGIDSLWFLGAMLPWLVLLWSNTGSCIPQTISAKRAFFAESGLPLGTKLSIVVGALASTAQHLGPIILWVVTLPFTRLGRVGLGFLGVFLLAYLWQFPGALNDYGHRYLYPAVVPLLFLGGLSLLRHSAKIAPRGSLVIGAVSLIFALWHFGGHWAWLQRWCLWSEVEVAGAARFCRESLPSGAPLLVHDAGLVAEDAGRPIVDLVGLKTPWVTQLHQRYTGPSGGRERGTAIQAIAERSGCTYVVVLAQWDDAFRLTASLQEAGWQLTLLRTFPQDYPIAPELRYQVYKITHERVGSGH